MTDLLVSERRDRMLLDMKSSQETVKIRAYEARLAEYEAKGNLSIQARETALAEFEERIRTIEDASKKWFRVELPRLLSGLPVTEEISAFGYESSLYDSSARRIGSNSYGNGYGNGYGNESSEGRAPNVFEDMTNCMPAMDKTYALTQALCSAKAIQASQDLKISSLEERNFILKEKVINLEGVILKWRDDVEGPASASASALASNDKKVNSISYPYAAGGSMRDTSGDCADSRAYSMAGEVSILQEQIRSLTDLNAKLEEENIEFRGKCEHLSERENELKVLLDSIVR
jgi:hypothetical protein